MFGRKKKLMIKADETRDLFSSIERLKSEMEQKDSYDTSVKFGQLIDYVDSCLSNINTDQIKSIKELLKCSNKDFMSDSCPEYVDRIIKGIKDSISNGKTIDLDIVKPTDKDQIELRIISCDKAIKSLDKEITGYNRAKDMCLARNDESKYRIIQNDLSIASRKREQTNGYLKASLNVKNMLDANDRAKDQKAFDNAMNMMLRTVNVDEIQSIMEESRLNYQQIEEDCISINKAFNDGPKNFDDNSFQKEREKYLAEKENLDSESDLSDGVIDTKVYR